MKKKTTGRKSGAEDIKAFHYNGVINIMLLKIIHKGYNDKDGAGGTKI